MRLTTPVVPLTVSRALAATLADFVDPVSPLGSLIRNCNALRVYHLQRTGVADWNQVPEINAGQPHILDGGWRFWGASGSLYGACHVGQETPGAPWKVTGVSDSVQVLTALQIYNRLSHIQIMDSGTVAFEPRILRIPWYPLEAFWLRSTDRAVPDHFVVFLGFPPPNLPDPTEPISWRDFRGYLGARANVITRRPGNAAHQSGLILR